MMNHRGGEAGAPPPAPMTMSFVLLGHMRSRSWGRASLPAFFHQSRRAKGGQGCPPPKNPNAGARTEAWHRTHDSSRFGHARHRSPAPRPTSVTVAAARLGDLVIRGRDLDRLVEPPSGERHRVVIAVRRLGHVLADELVRRVGSRCRWPRRGGSTSSRRRTAPASRGSWRRPAGRVVRYDVPSA